MTSGYHFRPHRSIVLIVRENLEFQLAPPGVHFPSEPHGVPSLVQKGIERGREDFLSFIHQCWCQCAGAQNPAFRGGGEDRNKLVEDGTKIRIAVRSPPGPGLSSTKSHRDGSRVFFFSSGPKSWPITSTGPDILFPFHRRAPVWLPLCSSLLFKHQIFSRFLTACGIKRETIRPYQIRIDIKMSQPSLTQRTGESQPHFRGNGDLALVDASSPELRQGLWLKDSLGPLHMGGWAG